MELSIYNIDGQDTGRVISLDDTIFGIEPNDHAIYLDVKQHMANKRQGTHKAKGRSEVAGSTRKLGKQKGGGGARPGDVKSPVRVGGGRIFGPTPRDYSFKINKKVKQLARKSALAYKVKNNQLIVLEDFSFDTAKTKAYIALTKNLKVNEKKTLLVLPEPNKSVYLSARNLEKSKVIILSELNTYKILDAQYLMLTEKSVANLVQNFNA
ncbi:MAG TPA: 50S ribosomal protein L4 [Paludibacteraceae bacterium]|nr:50S ribosomal protein L4 [Paludibacteraceae bacterium]HPL93854.1 50S ribosomal protein L4 [Paludibacteraceae bacterium]